MLPNGVTLPPGVPIRLRFRRTNDGESWWDDVEFPYGRVCQDCREAKVGSRGCFDDESLC